MKDPRAICGESRISSNIPEAVPLPIASVWSVAIFQPGANKSVLQVTRLAHAEDEVFQRLGNVLQKKSQLDLGQMRVRPTEIEYGAGEEAENDVQETQEGLMVSGYQRVTRELLSEQDMFYWQPTYDEQKDDDRMLDFLNLGKQNKMWLWQHRFRLIGTIGCVTTDFPGLRRQVVQESKASAAEQHIQENAREQYRLNKQAGGEKAFDYFKSDTYANSATERKRKATSTAERAVPTKAPKLGKGAIKTSLIEEEDDED